VNTSWMNVSIEMSLVLRGLTPIMFGKFKDASTLEPPLGPT